MSEGEKWCVYIHISPSNKAYIGITGDRPEDRWKKGGGYLKKNKNGEYTQPAIANAIKKYGWNNFEHIVFMDKLTKQEACRIEETPIALFDTQNVNHGYNIQKGGNSGNVGLKMNEDIRNKIKKLMQGKNQGENNPFYGKHHTEEAKKKISEHCNGMKGKKLSEESKEKMRCAALERFNGINGEKERRRLSEAMSDSAKKTAIICIETNQFFKSISDASKEYNINKGAIHQVLDKSNRTAKGYHWRKATEEESQNVQNS